MSAPNPPWLRETPDGVCLAIKAQPRASWNRVVGPAGAELKIAIAAPPVDSAANDELVRFLADRLDCPKSAVQLLRGAAARHKSVLVRGVPAQQILKKLAD